MSPYEDIAKAYRPEEAEVDIRISDWTKLGSAIRDTRKARGLSQHELARRAGVSRSWLARVETGHRGAELEPLFRLLNALDMSFALHDLSRPNEGTGEEPPPARTVAEHAGGRATGAATTQIDAAAAPELQTAVAPVLSAISKHQISVAGRRRAWRDASALLDNSQVQPAEPDHG